MVAIIVIGKIKSIILDYCSSNDCLEMIANVLAITGITHTSIQKNNISLVNFTA